MSKSKHTTLICGIIAALTLIATILLCMAASAGAIGSLTRTLGYEERLFDTSYVHSINIIMDEGEWENFLETAEDEEYVICSVNIDGETVSNCAIRAKGNTSLSSVRQYGNSRYSFKIEFDHYDDTLTYHGLDKLVLNNNIQDNTLMKDYLTYRMMAYMDVAAPLVSYAFVTVNGEDFGLYLALEAVEESFLQRNYGAQYGELYKPDSMSMGGGRGNGRDFDMQDFADNGGFDFDFGGIPSDDDSGNAGTGTMPQMPDMTNRGGFDPNSMPTMPNGNGETQQDGFDPNSAPTMPNGNGETQQGGFDPNSMPTMPNGNSNAPEGGFDIGNLPDIGNMGDIADKIGDMFGGNIGGGMNGSSDVSLIYSDDDFDSYSNIFDNAKTDITSADKRRLIASLKKLNENEDIESVVDIEQVIRYFAVHNFVDNFDSYTGSMIHNYYLYEQDGVLSMIPWDYNLAFGGFMGGSDATSLINYPIDTPVSGGSVENRPMLSWIFESEEYTALYHDALEELIKGFFTSGEFETLIDETYVLIAPYAERDTNGFCTYDEFVQGVSTLKQFCLLRAESISGQLDGSIPSTSAAQNADSSALIDGSALNISDMGGMDMGGGNMGFGGGDKRRK